MLKSMVLNFQIVSPSHPVLKLKLFNPLSQGRNRQGSTTALHASHLRDLADNPDLYGLLLSHLRERVVAAGGSAGDEDDDDEDEEEEEEGSRRVQCRVN